MSIRSEISRIRNLRDAIRTKLLTWGLVGETANLEACKTAIEDIADHTNATVNGDFSSGETGFITGQITEKGYYNEASKLKIPVSNFSEENIKKGVAIGGKVGTYAGEAYVKTISLNGNTVTITHELGVKPRFFALFRTRFDGTNNQFQIAWYSSVVASDSGKVEGEGFGQGHYNTSGAFKPGTRISMKDVIFDESRITFSMQYGNFSGNYVVVFIP